MSSRPYEALYPNPAEERVPFLQAQSTELNQTQPSTSTTTTVNPQRTQTVASPSLGLAQCPTVVTSAAATAPTLAYAQPIGIPNIPNNNNPLCPALAPPYIPMASAVAGQVYPAQQGCFTCVNTNNNVRPSRRACRFILRFILLFCLTYLLAGLVIRVLFMGWHWGVKDEAWFEHWFNRHSHAHHRIEIETVNNMPAHAVMSHAVVSPCDQSLAFLIQDENRLLSLRQCERKGCYSFSDYPIGQPLPYTGKPIEFVSPDWCNKLHFLLDRHFYSFDVISGRVESSVVETGEVEKSVQKQEQWQMIGTEERPVIYSYTHDSIIVGVCDSFSSNLNSPCSKPTFTTLPLYVPIQSVKAIVTRDQHVIFAVTSQAKQGVNNNVFSLHFCRLADGCNRLEGSLDVLKLHHQLLDKLNQVAQFQIAALSVDQQNLPVVALMYAVDADDDSNDENQRGLLLLRCLDQICDTNTVTRLASCQGDECAAIGAAKILHADSHHPLIVYQKDKYKNRVGQVSKLKFVQCEDRLCESVRPFKLHMKAYHPKQFRLIDVVQVTKQLNYVLIKSLNEVEGIATGFHHTPTDSVSVMKLRLPHLHD